MGKRRRGIPKALLKKALIGEAAWFQIFNDLKIEMGRVLEELRRMRREHRFTDEERRRGRESVVRNRSSNFRRNRVCWHCNKVFIGGSLWRHMKAAGIPAKNRIPKTGRK